MLPFLRRQGRHWRPARCSIASSRHTSSTTGGAGVPRQWPMMVAVTGGPCGGKTTALVELAEELPKLGVAVMRCPELSTLLFGAGAAFPGLGTRAEQLAWDYHKLRAQLALEDTLCSIAAESAQPTMVLMDRGALDSKAFVATGDEAGQHAWEQLLERGGWDEASLLSRYDAVIHLVTTAIGAEEHYSGATSNAARREDVAEAQAQDLRIRAAWQSHPKFCLVSNEHVSSFDEKLRHATAFLYQQEHFLDMITTQSDQTIER